MPTDSHAKKKFRSIASVTYRRHYIWLDDVQPIKHSMCIAAPTFNACTLLNRYAVSEAG